MLEEQHGRQLPEWIKDYRNQSWQIEILIAGGTVITLFSLAGHFQEFFYQTYPSINFTIYRTLALFGLYLVTRILLIGFTINLIFRAVWLAYLGINFSYPDGIDYDKLNGSETTKSMLRSRPNILQRLITLEKLCNLSYSLAVLMAIFATSIFISCITITAILDFLGFNDIITEAWFSYTLSFLIAFVQMGWLDKVLFSKKSKSRRLNKITALISSVLGFLTLSFLFRREILTIRTNTSRWKIYAASFLFLGFSTFISAYQIGKYWPYGTINFKVLDDRKQFKKTFMPDLNRSNYMEHFKKGDVAFRAAIQSEIVSDDYLKLFVVSWNIFDKFLAYSFEKNGYTTEGLDSLPYAESIDRADELRTIYSKTINDLLLVKIDGLNVGFQNWKAHKHPVTKEQGYMTFIPIDSLPKNEHDLQIYVRYFEKNDSIVDGRWTQIPFWLQ